MNHRKFYESLNEREKFIYNKGVLDSDRGLKNFFKALGQQAKMNKKFVGFLQNQNLCAPCKKWLRDWAKTQ